MAQQQHIYKIGDLAKIAGVTVRTIRYYEELGLLAPSETSPGGFRLYTENDRRKLLYIKRFKDLEFPLDEIKALFCSHVPAESKDQRINASLALLDEQLKQVENKMMELKKIKEDIKSGKEALLKCKSCQIQPCPPECPSKESIL